jgi:DNA-binding response OmpR family regulator
VRILQCIADSYSRLPSTHYLLRLPAQILIIEDEPRVASLLMNGLEENGYQTMVAYDGLMGLRLFQTHTFDLVISDIVLPKMDGFELAKEIRKTNPQCPTDVMHLHH